MSFDHTVMQTIADHRIAWATSFSRAMMQVGTSAAGELLLLVVAGVVVVWLRAFRPALAAVVALLVAGVASVLLKHAFDRPRPPAHLALVLVGGQSFPSTHAAVTSAVAVAFLVAYPWASARTAGLAAVVVAAALGLVGVCMVYLGAHWPTDILAGWLLGGAIGYLVGRLFQPRAASPGPVAA